MEQYSAAEVRAGVFFLIALALLTGMIFAMGAMHLGKGATMSTELVDTAFLKPGASVTLAGHPVGEVKSVETLPTIGPDGKARARVTFILRLSEPPPGGFVVHLKRDGMLGEKYLELVASEDPTAVALADDAVLLGEVHLSLVEGVTSDPRIDALISRTEQTIDEASRLVAQLNDVVAENRTPLKSAIDDISAITADIRPRTSQLLDSAQLAIDDFSAAIRPAREIIEENRAKISAALENFSLAMTDFRTTATSVRSLIDEARPSLFGTLRNAEEATYDFKIFARKIRARPSLMIMGSGEPEQTPVAPDETWRRQAGRVPRYGAESD